MQAFRRLLSLMAVLCLWPLVATADYTLSVTPRFSPEELLKRITPLAKKLSEVLGERVEVVVSSDFAGMEQRIKSGQIDIAYVNSIVYPLASNAHEAIAIASEGAGGAKLRGLVITRTDSNIVSPEDLRGRTASVVSFKSPGGFLSQKVALEKKGLSPETDMRLQEAIDNKQENVLLAVYLGDVDAGFVREDALNVADKYVPPSKIRVIMRGEWLPGWAISVKRTLPRNVKDKIRTTITGLAPGDPILTALKVDRFVAGSDADYDIVRKALGLAVPAR